jgi:hypothetical protein
MKSFEEFISENTINKIADTTGANKAVSRYENTDKFFVIREWTAEEIKEFGEYQTIKQGRYKWSIVDHTTPNYKNSFPISAMQNYTGGIYTKQIQIKYALKDIGNGLWKPENK